MTTAIIAYDQVTSAPAMWGTDNPSQQEKSFNNYWIAVYESIKEEKDIAKLMQSLHLYIIECKTSQKNLRLIKFLDQWMAEPDDLGEEFWQKFCEDIEKNRFTI